MLVFLQLGQLLIQHGKVLLQFSQSIYNMKNASTLMLIGTIMHAYTPTLMQTCTHVCNTHTHAHTHTHTRTHAHAHTHTHTHKTHTHIHTCLKYTCLNYTLYVYLQRVVQMKNTYRLLLKLKALHYFRNLRNVS